MASPDDIHFREEVFCASDEVEEYLAVVNSKLMTYGDPYGLPVEEMLKDEKLKPILSRVVNSMYGLLRKYEMERALHQQRVSEVERCGVEIDELQDKLERVQIQLEEAQSEAAHTHRVSDSLRKEITQTRQEAKSQKDQMQKTIASLTSRETQFKHESVRKEKQIEALKEKLKTIQITKNRPERQSMILLSSLWDTQPTQTPSQSNSVPPNPPKDDEAKKSIPTQAKPKSQNENFSFSNQKPPSHDLSARKMEVRIAFFLYFYPVFTSHSQIEDSYLMDESKIEDPLPPPSPIHALPRPIHNQEERFQKFASFQRK